jgi:hypothetical protein
VEKRAEIVYGIMVRRGIVIEEYEDIMKAPADGPPVQTPGAAAPAGPKEGASGNQGAAEPKGKEPTQP